MSMFKWERLKKVLGDWQGKREVENSRYDIDLYVKFMLLLELSSVPCTMEWWHSSQTLLSTLLTFPLYQYPRLTQHIVVKRISTHICLLSSSLQTFWCRHSVLVNNLQYQCCVKYTRQSLYVFLLGTNILSFNSYHHACITFNLQSHGIKLKWIPILSCPRDSVLGMIQKKLINANFLHGCIDSYSLHVPLLFIEDSHCFLWLIISANFLTDSLVFCNHTLIKLN